ncbi:hypothetical protein [Sphingomonas pituitosa]|uniref:hypothetical protein n=1 Tax=Sphingomonas pituitosa TaxID=99597 RepID=UPI00083203C0|nr:hypothetical protein [Sphingomonas pituitosa]
MSFASAAIVFSFRNRPAATACWKGIIVGCRHRPVGIHPPEQPPVNRGQPPLVDIAAEAASISWSVRGARSSLTSSDARSRRPWEIYSRAMIRCDSHFYVFQ